MKSIWTWLNMVEYTEGDRRIKRLMEQTGSLDMPIAIARRVRKALDDEGHDSWSVQAMPWDEAIDACVDRPKDLWEESILDALGIGAGSEGSHFIEAVEQGRYTDDFVSQANDKLSIRQGAWEIKPRQTQNPVKEFYGLDTETFQGWAKLIEIQPADEGHVYELWLEPKAKQSGLDMLRMLGSHSLRGTCTVSYNMRFDAESMLKHLLPHIGVSGLQKLCDYQVAEYRIGGNDWRIMYIPTKVLRISKVWHQNGNPNRKTDAFSLYDIAQFYPGKRLQEAAQQYLGESKISDIDASRLNVDLEYWSVNRSRIAEYCRQDARLCAKLAQFMSTKVNELWGVDFQNPYSPAQISQKIFLSRSGILHPILREDVLQFAYNAYYGGRIECRMRGHLPASSLADIKSAYIWAMVDLPDTKGEWVYTGGESSNIDNPQTPYAFVHATVETDCGEDDWGPLPVRRKDGLLVYPDGRLTGWWPWPEVQWWEQRGYVRKLTVHRCVYLVPDPDNHPAPFAYHNDIYAQKETEKDAARKHVIKTCGLGMYGKTAQAVEKLVPAGEDPPNAFVGTEPMKVALEPGYLFNPAIAAYITYRVRCKLMEYALAEKRKAAAVLTDSVIVQGKQVEDNGKKLGDWDAKAERGDCRVLMSGMYQFQGSRAKVRGLPMKDDNWDYWALKGESVKVVKPGPLHMHGALRRNQPELINVWIDRDKKVTPNADRKRKWEHWQTFEQFFSDQHTGKVLRVNMQSAKVVARGLGLTTKQIAGGKGRTVGAM